MNDIIDPSEREPECSPNTLSLPFVEELYVRFRSSPESVPPDWRRYFEELDAGARNGGDAQTGPTFQPPPLFRPAGPGRIAPRPASSAIAEAEVAWLQDRVDQLIRAYRVRGHMVAEIDPLGRPRPRQPSLEPAFYGITEADLDHEVSATTMSGPQTMRVREVVERLRQTYCRSIGVQFMHIGELEARRWLQERMEATQNHTELSRREQLHILRHLTEATVFEEFIQKRFVGAKSFSLEGAESLVPLLDLAIEKAGDQGIEEIVIGMTHRGRLNVLANILGKSPRRIFHEFEDADPELYRGRGDVKYHLGHSSDWETASGRSVHLSLCFNPSHLEFVNPVVLGRVRAKQDRARDEARSRCMGLLIHGDAAFAGQGIVQETLTLSQLKGYTVGGTMHVIVNNQIGFTTPPDEARSCAYATDVAKMLRIPIFHVNGEDPEAVAQVVRLALDFRRVFRRDVVIDMYCYRRRGHNETDEPAFTQPVLYRAIRKRKPVRESYLEHLLQLGGVTRAEADRIQEESREALDRHLKEVRSGDYAPPGEERRGVWAGYTGGPESEADDADTRVGRERLAQLLEAQTRLPEGFKPHPTLERWLKRRRAMARGERPLDWSAAEALAFASLASEGIRLRLSGQDSVRGTFSHRHAALYDVRDGHPYMPLQHLMADQGPVEIVNSPLSEQGVVGYEFGYSLDCPDGLVIWEAQFGDFVNCAQVAIDQFITSAEDKWSRLNGLVMLLPHGFEGMGPEHSSARLERFLSLAAEDNIQVVNLTTPAQYFHCLRRQVVRRWRKPLVVMSPKSLLRHPLCTSALEELAEGRFQPVLPDDEPDGQVRRVLLCTGKIYYDLLKRREELERGDVAIVRIEQLYPFPEEPLQAALARYPDGTPAVWVQEEPANMGAWSFLRVRCGERLLGRLPLSCVARAASASPATGSASAHSREQAELLDKALGG